MPSALEGFTGSTAQPYHPGVQNLQLGVLVVLGLTIVLRLLDRGGHAAHERGYVAVIVVGLAAGLVGSVVVLTQLGDLVPDPVEGTVSPAFVIAATAVLLYLVWKPRLEG